MTALAISGIGMPVLQVSGRQKVKDADQIVGRIFDRRSRQRPRSGAGNAAHDLAGGAVASF